MLKLSQVAALGLLAFVAPACLAADHGVEPSIDVTYSNDDNQSQAANSRDRVEDQSVSGQLSLIADLEFATSQLLTVRLFGEKEAMDEVGELDRSTFGGAASWRLRYGRGFTAPIFEVSASIQDDNYDTDQRDSTVTRVQAFVTRRLTDRLTLTVGGEYRKRDSEGSVWDLEDGRGFLNADLMLNQRAAIYGTYSRINGDVASSAQRSFCNGSVATDIFDLVDAATAIEKDEAYNSAFCGEWVAYRLDARSNVLTLGFNYALGHSMALDLSALDADVEGSSDNSYQRRLYRATLLKRF